MKKLTQRFWVATATVATIVGLTAPYASADPSTVDQARAELKKIRQEAADLDAEIIKASQAADDATKKLGKIKQDLTQQKKKVAALSDSLGRIAVMQFQSNGLDLTAQLLTSESEDHFLSSLATIESETHRSNSDIQQFQAEQGRMQTLESQLGHTQKTLQDSLTKKRALAKEFDAKEAKAEAVYNRLKEEDRQRLLALEANQAPVGESDGTAARSNTMAMTSRSNDARGQEEVAAAPASGRGGSVVSLAMSKVGSRYVFGATGPSAFDCSGFASWAYRQVGISLPRTSSAQARSGSPVSVGNLQPGDLVFYYGGASHVGIYIGNGKIVHAANPRRGVLVAGVNSMPIHSARRYG